MLKEFNFFIFTFHFLLHLFFQYFSTFVVTRHLWRSDVWQKHLHYNNLHERHRGSCVSYGSLCGHLTVQVEVLSSVLVSDKHDLCSKQQTTVLHQISEHLLCCHGVKKNTACFFFFKQVFLAFLSSKTNTQWLTDRVVQKHKIKKKKISLHFVMKYIFLNVSSTGSFIIDLMSSFPSTH